MHIRLSKEHVKPIKALAAHNRRSIPREVGVAIDLYVAENRELLKSGPKLRKP